MKTFKQFLQILSEKKKDKEPKLSKKEKERLPRGVVKTGHTGDFNIGDTERPVETAPGSPERAAQIEAIMRASGAKAFRGLKKQQAAENLPKPKPKKKKK